VNTQKTLHALVVGAEQPLRQMVQITLHRAGFSVHTVGSGQELFYTLATVPVDVVLLNVLTPGREGFALCATLRQASDVPILLLFQQGRTEEILQGFELGADDCVCQPFEPLDLLFRIEALLRRMAWQRLSRKATMILGRQFDQPTTNPWGVMM